MSGAALHADFTGLKRIAKAIEDYAAFDRRRLLDRLGAAGASQTQRRISDEKAAPDGTPWPQWSPRYARTRHDNQSLLIGEGHLVSGITHNVISEDAVEWGTPEIYGATHQFGDPARGIPARPFEGISPENGEELLLITHQYLASLGPREAQ